MDYTIIMKTNIPEQKELPKPLPWMMMVMIVLYNWPYLPRYSGFRFSKNAVMPSLKSSVSITI